MFTNEQVASLVIERLKANGTYETLGDEQPCKLFHIDYATDKEADESAITAILAQIPSGSKIGQLQMPEGVAGLVMTDGNVSCRVLSFADMGRQKLYRRIDIKYAD